MVGGLTIILDADGNMLLTGSVVDPAARIRFINMTPRPITDQA
jgi:hypothetical protein